MYLLSSSISHPGNAGLYVFADHFEVKKCFGSPVFSSTSILMPLNAFYSIYLLLCCVLVAQQADLWYFVQLSVRQFPFPFPKSLGHEILCPKILSAVILGHGILDLRILDPRILGPRILDPRILGPRILDPRILGPTILGAGIMGARILCPIILCPGIFGPGTLGLGD